jgi:hypothetical protein
MVRSFVKYELSGPPSGSPPITTMMVGEEGGKPIQPPRPKPKPKPKPKR